MLNIPYYRPSSLYLLNFHIFLQYIKMEFEYAFTQLLQEQNSVQGKF